jgi:hypothetical protein
MNSIKRILAVSWLSQYCNKTIKEFVREGILLRLS